jgi:hypothetical protein
VTPWATWVAAAQTATIGLRGVFWRHEHRFSQGWLVRTSAPHSTAREATRFHLLTRRAPKPKLTAGSIRAGMSLRRLGHGAKAASSGRTQVGGDSGR